MEAAQQQTLLWAVRRRLPDASEICRGTMQIIILIALFGLMYVVLILPQQRKMRRHQEFVSRLQVGDEIMTSSGIYGTITDIEGDIIHLAVDTDVVVRVARGSIAQMEAGEGSGDPAGDEAIDDEIDDEIEGEIVLDEVSAGDGVGDGEEADPSGVSELSRSDKDTSD
ncbi:MAG: preprotein translocase subunit YajC [Actinobacteria bacterium]|nr:MAG: preprotein translocase subunit YajC [Actinomycetota bacterium]RIK05643.1 MAG: preprotein translocase subunit YajC [Acidobacteriota bacterium]